MGVASELRRRWGFGGLEGRKDHPKQENGTVRGPHLSRVGDSLNDSKTAIRDVVRNRNLRRLSLAFAGSVVGDWAYAVAAALYAYSRGGASAVGILAVVRYVLLAVLTPFTSMLADRFDRRTVMVTSDLVRVVLVLLGALVIRVDGPSIAVYVIVALNALVIRRPRLIVRLLRLLLVLAVPSVVVVPACPWPCHSPR